MYALKTLIRTPSPLIAHLRVFSTQVLRHPAHEETVATWKEIENKLPPQYQSPLLRAWNRHLAGTNKPKEIVTAVDEVIRQLRR